MDATFGMFVFLGICFHHALAIETEFLTQIESTETSNEGTSASSNSDAESAPQLARRSRQYRLHGKKDDDYGDDHDDDRHNDVNDHHDDHMDMKAISEPKVDYWGGYYDFLINEGSYKFWAVFQLATAALLIYSGFAALYYAKVNPATTDDEFDDLFRRRRRRSFGPQPEDQPFSGLDSATFQRIVDAVAREVH